MNKLFTKVAFFCISVLFISISTNAQTTKGLEKVIVEKYYVSNEADMAASAGNLPVGSVTWRIYLDMLPGYKFQTAYGDSKHPLSITTTTSFFNNEDRGNTTPTFSKTNAKNNTVMLDSWLTAGAACAGNFGILKSDDDGVATVINADGVLQGADASAGIALTAQDGLLAGTPGQCGFIGVDGVIDVFDATSQSGNSFSTTNGAWYCLEGAMGPDSTKNRVLIAQLTTDGELSYKLTVQIGTPEGNAEYYVAENPGYVMLSVKDSIAEILDTTLTFRSSEYIPTAVVENGLVEKEITVYPNPTKDLFYISLPSDFTAGTYTIYNMVGNRVASKNIASSNEKVDLSNYINGIYFVEVKSKGIRSTFKVIKKE